MTTFLIVIGCIVGAVYLGLPLIVRKTFVTWGKPSLEPVTREDMPNHVTEALDPICQALEERGYREAGRCELRLMKNTASFNVILRNDDLRDMALVSYAQSESTDAQDIGFTSAEFMTLFPNDQRVETCNAPTPLPGVDVAKGHRRTQIPDLDVNLLADAHRKLVAQMRPLQPLLLPLPGEENALVLEECQRHIKASETKRYYERDRETGDYGLTLKGAYLYTWRELPPIRQLLTRRCAARGARILRSLGLEAPAVAKA